MWMDPAIHMIFFSFIFDGSISIFSLNYAFIMLQYRLVSGFSSHFISTFCMSTFISVFPDPSSTCHSPSGHWMGSCLFFSLICFIFNFSFHSNWKCKWIRIVYIYRHVEYTQCWGLLLLLLKSFFSPLILIQIYFFYLLCVLFYIQCEWNKDGFSYVSKVSETTAKTITKSVCHELRTWCIKLCVCKIRTLSFTYTHVKLRIWVLRIHIIFFEFFPAVRR